jgi:hypothetical protein
LLLLVFRERAGTYDLESTVPNVEATNPAALTVPLGVMAMPLGLTR